MSFCSNCGKAVPEGDRYCAYCGTPAGGTGEARHNYPQPTAKPADITDHTAEFDSEDISANKVICMLPYLLGCVGVIIAMLGQSTSKYVAFHVRQVLKIVVVEALLTICALVLCWTVIVPAAAVICMVITLVLRIMGFVYVCGGKAKEIPIISSLGFLK